MKANTAKPVTPVIVKLTQLPHYAVEVDGTRLPGVFNIDSEWEGMLKLTCTGPCQTIIVEAPRIPHVNIHDLVPKAFGGNRKSTEPLEIECVAIRPPQ